MNTKEKHQNPQSELKKKEALRLSNAESKALTRSCIRTALLMLLGEKRYEDITTTEIIKKSGVSRAGFYRNYRSKLEVIQELHTTHASAVIDALNAVQDGAEPEPVFKELFEWLESDEEICKYYIDHLRHTYDNWHCTGEGDHGVLNEQAGLLLADSWHTGALHTFYRIDWYDWMSCGNNTRESWWTVDATTGKLLSLSDFILPDKQDALTALMMPRIVNGKREKLIKQYPTYIAEAKDLLKRADGCALIPEGLVIFFYPYNLGTGADGEYEAVIPFEELNEILKQPILKMVSITE